jgi:Dolichyl-phosphate-mannose-protein mannosyltransferase
VALVGASAILHWLAGRRLVGLWIMPDEAIYARRALALWQHGSLPLQHGQGAGYGVVYPVVAGLPLSLGSFTHGYASLKVVQALIVSLAAVPVYAYGRRLMPPAYALLAAALTAASPLLLYSGLVMTEVVFYPVAAATTLAIARAVETATSRDQGIALALVVVAVLTRVQAAAFVAVFAAAILLDALVLSRERGRLRRFWPVWVVLVVAAVVAVAKPSVLGPYAGTLRGSYPLGDALGLAFDHLAYVVLATGVLPVFALIMLLARRLDPGARALVATTTSALAVLVLQVGFFAARYAPHLLGRDLAALPPLFFLVFALWLARGAPRGRVASVLAALGLLGVLLLAPWNRLVAPEALPDSLDLALPYRITAWSPTTSVMVAAVALVTAAVVLSRRWLLVPAVAVLALLVASSVVASNEMTAAVRASQANIVGSPPDWIDRTATGRVTYVYAGESYWNSVWFETFWNQRVEDVVALAPATVPGPMPQVHATIAPNGAIPITDRFAVANDRLAFVGSSIGHLAQTGLDVSGLTLWHLDGQPRLSTSTNGVLPNGDIVGPATVDVYDCRAGRLELTLLPKASTVVRVLLDGHPAVRAHVKGLAVWHGAVSAQPRPGRRCRFTILGDSLLGSTRIAFVRP